MSKKIKTILYLFLLFNISCINDLAFYHDSASESREKGLLVCEYRPDRSEIEIDKKKYKIIEAWTAYKFKSRSSKEVYKEIITFTFVLEDSSKNRKPDTELIGLIECKNKDVLFNRYVGISDSQFRVSFKKNQLIKLIQ